MTEQIELAERIARDNLHECARCQHKSADHCKGRRGAQQSKGRAGHDGVPQHNLRRAALLASAVQLRRVSAGLIRTMRRGARRGNT